ncbi:MAG: hypothetical protein HN566_08580, partial [Polaribacter sp.]|nr:hypothetical protein [Polaribacter sp.]
MYKFSKRIFDISSSFIACVILIPILIPIVIILRLTSEGDIFYLQERIGLYKKSFMI